MRRVLVSGSAGFIGGYLVAELLNRGYEVTGVDDYSKYGKVRRSYDDHPRYRLVIGDAGDTGLMTGLLADCDHFVAGAALVGGIGYFHAFPYDLLAANERIIAGSCDAALAAHRAGRLRKVTYISSSMVYEGTRHWPSREGDERDIPPPPSAYGFQKLAVEYFARAAWQQYGLPYTIVRPFNCVGAGEYEPVRDTGGAPGNAALALCHVVPDLVRKALTGQDPLRILGSGDQVRHYTYGGDLARGIVAAMEHPRAAGQDFNLSSARATTVRELAALIWRLTRGDGEPPRIAHDPPFEHDVQCRAPATGKARQVLGFEAATSLEDMLTEVIGWITSQLAVGAL